MSEQQESFIAKPRLPVLSHTKPSDVVDLSNAIKCGNFEFNTYSWESYNCDEFVKKCTMVHDGYNWASVHRSGDDVLLEPRPHSGQKEVYDRALRELNDRV